MSLAKRLFNAALPEKSRRSGKTPGSDVAGGNAE